MILGAVTARDLLRLAAESLKQAGIDTPVLDARLLLQHSLGCSREDLLGDLSVTEQQQTDFEVLLRRRLAREPVSRITGRRGFWTHEFRLSPDTLDPRPDSETLVETALDFFPDRPAPLRILDLGTGTGCLLLSILSEYPHASGLGVDLAPGAVETASANARDLGLEGRAVFREGSWAEGIEEAFDLVISNPPYIPAGDIAGLEPEVRDHDPRLALAGGADGLEAYRTIARDLPRLLKPQGYVLLEVGAWQADDISALLGAAGLAVLPHRRDLAGIDRVVVGHQGI
ncbi:MAG: peptide chain release factor N(5)-glutamine methyltransferase [Pseudomonadota bacterium]|nr:peptide chain release factor N(5)-glutamine methyltransferase [Pseudomonadota bacterium]